MVTASYFAAGDGHIAWWTVRKTDGGLIVDIWAIPIGGGTPRKITTFPGIPHYGGIDLTIAEGKATWSLWKDGGVYQVPLSGGRPALIPGSEKHHLIAWPWAAYPRLETGTSSGRVKPPKEPYMGHLLNLRTGERQQATLRPGEKWLNCGITWCVGFRSARHRDGTGERGLPGGVTPISAQPALDRFLLLMQNRAGERLGITLYDLSTGRAVDLGIPSSNQQIAVPTFDYRLPGIFRYELGGEQVVVDLAAIGRTG
ncbi:hypothetical protein [Sphaerisporangium perillae]|uniref:hypothetical protein n=1 Tax=Sphaerisporangium perillae TaxID=2935860 RepID=UPI00200DCCCC|nr:hypothetical protein [Sphaerisporangium perillae]